MRFLIALLSMYCCAAAQAETIIYNVKGYSIENHAHQGAPKIDTFTTVVFDKDSIIATGSKALLKQFKNAKKIDGDGQVMLPGIIDAHGHMKNLGMNMLRVDLRGIDSLKGTLKALKEYAAAHPDLPWIIGRGWNQVLWKGKKFPTAQDLDSVIGDRPVVLERIDGHAIWVNSKAMQMASVDKDTRSPIGGEIIRDKQGNPSGIFIDLASNLINSFVPKPDEKTLIQALNLAQQHLLSLGITSVHDAGIEYADYKLYRKLNAKRKLIMRIYAMLSASDSSLAKMVEEGIINHEKLVVRSVKAYSDGALGSRGAALLEDYHDEPGQRGLMLISRASLNQLTSQLAEKQFQLNVHAIGDAANRMVLDVFEQQMTSEQRRKLRPRVEHAQVVSVDDLQRFKSLNLIASMQPVHATSDMNMAGDRVGEKRLQGAYAWRTLLDQKTLIASGSDFPVELANPWHGIHAAVTRQSKNNQPKGGWRADQKMQLAEALRSFTLDAAYAAFMEGSIGNLAPGKKADFILLEEDPFALKPQELWQIEVNQTWIGGQQVYQAKP